VRRLLVSACLTAIGCSPILRPALPLPAVTATPPHSLAALTRQQVPTRARTTRSQPRTTSSSSPSATPAERSELACIRYAESRDLFWQFGYYPNGGGDGGGAFQFERATWLVAAGLAGIDPSNQTAGAQYKAALALLRADHGSDWAGDGCV